MLRIAATCDHRPSFSAAKVRHKGGRLRQRIKILVLCAIVGVTGVALHLTPIGLTLSESIDLDWLFTLRGVRAAPDSIVIVSINRASAQALSLPKDPVRWPRALHAALVDKLVQAGVRTIGFDVMFRESQSGINDVAFADAMKRAGNVFLFAYLDLLPLTGGLKAQRIVEPHEQLRAAARATAIFPMPKYPKRVNQFWNYKAEAGGALTLPYVMAQHFTASALSVPSSLYLNFYGPAGTIKTVSYSQVLTMDDEEAAKLFAGKAVLVGLSETVQTDQADIFFTVFSQSDGRDLSGVEIAASALGNLIEGGWIKPLSQGVALLVLLAWGALFTALCCSVSTTRAMILAFVASASYLFGAYVVFATFERWIPLFIPLVIQAPVALFALTLWRYREESRERRKVRAALGHYLPSAVVDEIADDIAQHRQTQKLVYGVCLVTDAERYTTLSEHMSPQQLGRFMNQYYGVLFPAVRKTGGIISDVVGDSMMALWASLRNPDARQHAAACRAALEMRVAVEAFNREQAWPLPTRFGLHAGEMALGNVGTIDHFEYRAVGDIVNTASRIQGLNKQLRTCILASSEVLRNVEGLLVRDLGNFVLTGKSQPVRLYEIIGDAQWADPIARECCNSFARIRESWELGDEQEAQRKCEEHLRQFPKDGPALFYLDLCRKPKNRTTTGLIYVEHK